MGEVIFSVTIGVNPLLYSMNIILLQKIEKLGNKNDIVNVKNGHALNFLIPQGLAVVASADKIRQLEAQKQKAVNEKQKEEEELHKMINKIKDKKITLKKKASEKGVLFAAVSVAEILAAIKNDLGVKLEQKQVKIGKHIKEAGEHQVELLISGKKANLMMVVTPVVSKE